MKGFLHSLEDDMQLERWLLKQIQAELKRLPKGRLKMGKKGKAVYFREAKAGGKTKAIRPESKLAKAITRRRFLEQQKKIIESNLKAQANLPESYKPYSHEAIMQQLSQVYQTVDLLAQMELERKREAARKESERNAFHPENLKHVTQKGKIHRSKSETIIAMIVDGFRIPYNYEERVYWPEDAPAEAWEIKEKLGIRNFYVPDFTYVFPDGRKIYHEHLGLMDDAEYMEDFKKKLILYYWAGITPGDNLIITADDCKRRINQKEIAKLLEFLLKELMGTAKEL